MLNLKVLPLVLCMFIIVCFLIYSAQASSTWEGSIVYNVYFNGTTMVTVTLVNIKDYSVSIPVNGIVNVNSIIALDPSGLPLPYDFNGTHIEVYTVDVDKAIVIYTTYNLTTYNNGVWTLNINTFLPPTIYLPRKSIILKFNDTPIIRVENEKIILQYAHPGSYEVKFTVEALATYTITNTTATIIATKPTTPTTYTPQTPTNTTRVPMPNQTNTSTVTTLMPTITSTSPPPATSTFEETTRTPRVTVELPIIGIVLGICAIIGSILLYAYVRHGQTSKTTVIVGEVLDKRDNMILNVLKERGELSLIELSKITKLSKSVVWRRVQKLSKLGYVETRYVSGKLIVKLSSKEK